VAARAVAQGFRLLAATTLFVDPSIACSSRSARRRRTDASA